MTAETSGGRTMSTNKPYRGEIHEWKRRHFDEVLFPNLGHTLGYVIVGIPINHPTLTNWIITSAVVDYDETTGELETINSIYKLVPARMTKAVKL
jgi:hypothetical protein